MNETIIYNANSYFSSLTVDSMLHLVMLVEQIFFRAPFAAHVFYGEVGVHQVA